MKKSKNIKESYFSSQISNILIFLVFTLIAVLTIGLFYFVVRYIFVQIFKLEKTISASIAIVISILTTLIIAIPSIKKEIHRFINYLHQRIYVHNKKNRFHRLLNPTSGQSIIINNVLSKLTSTNERILIIEGPSGNGKTTAAVLLFDKIGKTTDLLNMFMKLRKHSFYFDMRIESKALIHHLSNQDKAAKTLTIIDNTHKMPIEIVDDVMKEILSLLNHASSIGSINFILILCQTDSKVNSMGELLKQKLLDNRIDIGNITYSLDTIMTDSTKINKIMDQDGELYNMIMSLPMQRIKNHLIRIYTSASSPEFMKKLIEFVDNSKSSERYDESEELKFIVTIVVFSAYLGYVTKDMIKWIYYHNRGADRRKYRKHLKYFFNNGFLEPLPLIHNAYLLNENLTRDYRKCIFENEVGKQLYLTYAEYIYTSDYFSSDNLKWFYLITCATSVYQSVNSKIRDDLFYKCKKSLNKEYIMNVLEAEIKLVPEKANILAKELVLIYIETGHWTKARNHFRQFLSAHKEDDQQLYLQLIEADHGNEDSENICMLNAIISKTDDEYIRFLAKYWLAHINLEHGDFSLTSWTELQQSILTHGQWKEQSSLEKVLFRISIDACRAYFLRGIFDESIFNNFMEFLPEYETVTDHPKDLARMHLLKAQNLHYGPIFELGIWNFYSKCEPVRRVDDSILSCSELIECSLRHYEDSIKLFNSLGLITVRTSLINKNDLELYCDKPDFIEIIASIDEFLEYADRNKVGVFTAYGKCLKGKAITVFALSDFLAQNETSQYEYYLKQALQIFAESIRTYEVYKNTYGVYRANFLIVLVELLLDVCSSDDQGASFTNCVNRLRTLTENYPVQSNIQREIRIIEYFMNLSKVKITQVARIIKYYPVILQ